MRLIAALCTLLSLAAAGFAGQALWQQVTAPETAITAKQDQTTQAGSATPPAVPRVARHWPAIFGEPQPPKPAPVAQPVKAEPQPPKPPKPPLDSLGYTLKGVVRAGSGTWAILSHPTGEQLLRDGDALAEGIIVARIDEAGLWVSRDGDEPELLAFPKQP
ncbi:type II secretion system protein N [Thalassovita sp.]|uniref:type II secretion system protein N n=1 Tax=Thalassovita sp. TaxID=1979401 RepID=UPI002B269509|nr:type II secretion system protein N [Thalassovita sp.]